MFLLWHIIVMFIIAFLEGVIGVTVLDESFGIVTALYFILTMIPYFAVMIRRLHDVNHSAWWILINIIPIIGGIVFLAFTLQDSHPGENKYGARPKE